MNKPYWQQSPWRKLADPIINKIRNKRPDDEIGNAIVQALEAAYRQGFDKADANPRQPESMGR